jgi:hypothetical protein
VSVEVFVCAGCGAELTAPVSRVALPVHTHQRWGHDLLPALMQPGTYAVDLEPSGPPWRLWNEIDPDEAAARGVFAPVAALSFGSPGASVVAPGDIRGTVLIPERCDGYCLGLDGRDGPNLACARCGRPVATRIDDCSFWQAVWLAPDAVRRLPTGNPVAPPVSWDALAAEPGTPPVEPPGGWSARWEAAAGAALAHLLAASGGRRVVLADSLNPYFLGRGLDALLPPGPPDKRAALAGPGLPDSAPDIALVPVHPVTGAAWQPPDGAEVVPLAAEVWSYLAFPYEEFPLPATGGLPAGFFQDYPRPLHPTFPFRPDNEVFLHTLSRLPAVRAPWLRQIHTRAYARPSAYPF